ncbi:hypothetical protein NC653_040976 [Populus alba x Populus x berolinensis]|uniref:t-SNARE coiled-coil homology domain-containing protein n=1 Tax=Populus alba x Populus x berolinensis TaxID=444605 RepID=A0AAD6PQ80_9ROSI|nr:hypothetical protein NC653_040976 [Populus alba x Populus x berolinensis]
MALMVEAQGEQMDDIEHHVLKASHYVKDGTKELKSAKDHQKSSRKWMIDWILQNLCTVDRVKKPVSGVRILQDKFPTSFLDSVWNLCNWHDEPLPNEICNIKVLDKKGRIRDGIPEHQTSESVAGYTGSCTNLCTIDGVKRPLVTNHFPTKSAILKFLTRKAGLGTESPNIRLLRWLPFTKWHIRFSGIYGCSSCIEAISDFRDYQLRISNVSTNDKKAKIVCGVAVLISVVAENLKNSAWIDDFYRSLPASDAFRYTGSCTNLCTVDRVKKERAGVCEGSESEKDRHHRVDSNLFFIVIKKNIYEIYNC